MIPNLNQVNPMASRVVDLSKYSRMNDLYLFEKQINMGYEIKKYLSLRAHYKDMAKAIEYLSNI